MSGTQVSKEKKYQELSKGRNSTHDTRLQGADGIALGTTSIIFCHINNLKIVSTSNSILVKLMQTPPIIYIEECI